jgi:uncharacterized protein with HEPN domain
MPRRNSAIFCGVTYVKFEQDKMMRYAAERLLLIIGEIETELTFLVL